LQSRLRLRQEARSKKKSLALRNNDSSKLCLFLVPGILVSSSRPTKAFRKEGGARPILAYRARTISHVDLMSCKESIPRASLPLFADQEYQNSHETTRRIPCFSFRENNARDSVRATLRACRYRVQALRWMGIVNPMSRRFQNGRASPVRCKLTGH
jgi:hypothetical protein